MISKIRKYLLDLINKDIQATETRIKRYEHKLSDAISSTESERMKEKLKKTNGRLATVIRHRERLKMILAKEILND